MDKSKVVFLKKPRLKDAILIEGLPGMGYVGKLAAEHLVGELRAEKFAEMYSPYFPHYAYVEPGGLLRLARNEFYYANINGKSVVILVGDAQATSPEGHYEIARKILEVVKRLKIKQIFTLGGYATGRYSEEKPKVIGASNHPEFVELLREHGVKIEDGAGPIIGASGLLLSLGKTRGVKGICLLGETHGVLVDHRSAQAVLEVLTDILGVKIDMHKLEELAKRTERIIHRIRKEWKARKPEETEEEVSYIG